MAGWDDQLFGNLPPPPPQSNPWLTAQMPPLTGPPARPVTPTPMTAQDLSGYLYGTWPGMSDPQSQLPSPSPQFNPNALRMPPQPPPSMPPQMWSQRSPMTGPPARPFSPTPLTQDELETYGYGGGAPQSWSPAPPQPLPSWLPQAVQNYIRTQPQMAEGQRPPPRGFDMGMPSSEPQISDIYRLFGGRIAGNAPTGALSPDFYRSPFFKQMLRGGHISSGADMNI